MFGALCHALCLWLRCHIAVRVLAAAMVQTAALCTCLAWCPGSSACVSAQRNTNHLTKSAEAVTQTTNPHSMVSFSEAKACLKVAAGALLHERAGCRCTSMSTHANISLRQYSVCRTDLCTHSDPCSDCILKSCACDILRLLRYAFNPGSVCDCTRLKASCDSTWPVRCNSAAQEAAEPGPQCHCGNSAWPVCITCMRMQLLVDRCLLCKHTLPLRRLSALTTSSQTTCHVL